MYWYLLTEFISPWRAWRLFEWIIDCSINSWEENRMDQEARLEQHVWFFVVFSPGSLKKWMLRSISPCWDQIAHVLSWTIQQEVQAVPLGQMGEHGPSAGFPLKGCRSSVCPQHICHLSTLHSRWDLVKAVGRWRKWQTTAESDCNTVLVNEHPILYK